MTAPEHEAFLAAFTIEHGETLAGFAVLGGIFGAGIDLVREHLVGAVIVGVGLPKFASNGISSGSTSKYRQGRDLITPIPFGHESRPASHRSGHPPATLNQKNQLNGS